VIGRFTLLPNWRRCGHTAEVRNSARRGAAAYILECPEIQEVLMQLPSRSLGVLTLFLLAILVIPGAIAAQETEDTTKLAPALRTARNALTAAWMARDAQAVSRFFADSAAVSTPDQTLNGKAAIDGWLAETTQALSAVRFGTSRFVISESEVTERSTYTVVLGDGTEQSGSAENIWRRQADGSWKVTRLTVS
jgi:ketosteroid isomerase-like protein